MPKVIIIDPGHGGNVEVGGSSANNATSASGVPEKVMTLQMAFLFRTELIRVASEAGLDIEIFLTRERDENVGLMQRANLARRKKADRFLSLHFNGFNGRARGVETLVSPRGINVNFASDHRFATKVQKAAFNAIYSRDAKTTDRGVKEQKLGVLNDLALGNSRSDSRCSACLLELEFIDVKAVDYLFNLSPDRSAFKQQIAKEVVSAILADILANP